MIKFFTLKLSKKDNLDFPIYYLKLLNNYQFYKSYEIVVECKGMGTNDLRAFQNYGSEAKNTPINQLWNYMGDGDHVKWGICTNK